MKISRRQQETIGKYKSLPFGFFLESVDDVDEAAVYDEGCADADEYYFMSGTS